MSSAQARLKPSPQRRKRKELPFLTRGESVPVFGAGDGFHLTVEEHKKLGLAVGSALRKLLEINALGAC